jgi:hypothetical protein
MELLAATIDAKRSNETNGGATSIGLSWQIQKSIASYTARI